MELFGNTNNNKRHENDGYTDKELGADVKIVRNSDDTINPTGRVNRIFNAYGNDSNVVVLSNHLNSGGHT